MTDVFLVTGGSRGIGEAIAIAAGQAGYHVALTYVGNRHLAEAVAQRIRDAGGEATAIRADTGKWDEIEAMFAATDAIGTLKVFCYNGGITGPSSPLAETSNETLQRVIDVNLTGALIASREAVKRMSTALGGRGGSIILISSRAAELGSPGEHLWYAASKGGIDSMNIGLSKEVAAQGIRVNVVSPGPISTDIHVPGKLDRIAAMLPMQRVGDPEEVAAAVMFLASDGASYISGANIDVAGAR